jgi:hypothetical protein
VLGVEPGNFSSEAQHFTTELLRPILRLAKRDQNLAEAHSLGRTFCRKFWRIFCRKRIDFPEKFGDNSAEFSAEVEIFCRSFWKILIFSDENLLQKIFQKILQNFLQLFFC